MGSKKAAAKVTRHTLTREALAGWGPTLRLCLLTWVQRRAHDGGARRHLPWWTAPAFYVLLQALSLAPAGLLHLLP